MSSQEDYLDQLLRNIMNGGKEQPQSETAEPVAEEAAAEPVQAVEEMNAAGAVGEAQWATDAEQAAASGAELPVFTEEVQGIPEESSVDEGMPGELPGMEDMFDDPDMEDLSAFMEGFQRMPEEMQVIGGIPEEQPVGGGMPEELSGMEGMTGDPGLEELLAFTEGFQGMPEEPQVTGGMPEEQSGMEGMSGDLGLEDLSALTEGLQGMPEEQPVVGGIPGEQPGVEGMFEEMPVVEGMPEEQPGVEGMFEELPVVGGMSDEQPGVEGMFEELPVVGGMPEEQPGMEGMTNDPGLEELLAFTEGFQGTSEGQPVVGGIPDEQPVVEGMPDELPGGSENMSEEPTDDIEDLFKTFEVDLDSPVGKEEAGENFPEALPSDFPDSLFEEEAEDSSAADISSMSEDDIERLLAESRGASGDSPEVSGDPFQGDVVDLLKGTEDGDLQEIQNLLEKSDNNEAVDDEIESILKEAVQESYQNSTGSRRPGTDAEQEEGAEEQLSPKQQKAMEKKRLKEEKAAAKKAAREARKAEKAAKKAARKGGNAANAETDGAAAGAGDSLDTAFLDSILSEAGKIDGAETISSATGNYDIKVDNIIPEEEENASATQKGAAGADSSVNDLGIDLNNLFGDSAEAESAMMAGGDSDLAGFVALDGNEVDGIIELGGGDEEEDKPKKKGFFSRFLEFLTEEEEEEEENEDIKLSEENQEIIDDLDKEKAQKDKKGKKGKKKAKKADASSEDGEEGGEGEEDKKGKKKKAKKPKKEKLPKEKEPVDPKARLSLKKVLPIVLICLSLGAAIIILVYGSVNFSDRRTARNAYYEGDYRTCYQNLYGKDLNESEQVMFGKSECILRIRMWIREYEILSAEGKSLEALDSLIQSVNDYPELYDYAGQCNAAGEVAQEYATILNLLYENYGLTEEQARTIAAEPDDIEYTRQVNAIAQGGAYGSWNEPEPEVDAPLQDELPEETELPEGNFIDTNVPVQ